MSLRSSYNLEVINPRIINFPTGEGFNSKGERNLGIAGVFGTNRCLNDHCLVGKPELIDTLTNLYDNVPKMSKRGCMINNETLIGINFLDHAVDFGPTDFLTYVLYRI